LHEDLYAPIGGRSVVSVGEQDIARKADEHVRCWVIQELRQLGVDPHDETVLVE